MSDAELAALPRDVSLQRTVQRVRSAGNGPNVNEKNAHDIVLTDELKQTNGGQRFFLIDSRDEDPEAPVFFIYASDYGIRLLRENSNWTIDGTFYCCPPSFKQMFSINVFKEESSLPGAFFLLPDKTAETYQRAFTSFFNHPLLNGISPDAVMSGKLWVFNSGFPVYLLYFSTYIYLYW